MTNKLYRVKSDEIIAGVCSGLGRYMSIDATIVRIFFVLVAVANGGVAIMAYLILWVVMPADEQITHANVSDAVRAGTAEMAGQVHNLGDGIRRVVRERPRDVSVIVGVVLIVLGGLALLQNLDLPWMRWFTFDLLWPVLLIVGGLALLVRQIRGA